MLPVLIVYMSLQKYEFSNLKEAFVSYIFWNNGKII